MALPHDRFKGDIYLDAARGKNGFSFVHKFGHTPNASTTSNPIWSEGGAYTYLTTAKFLKVASDDTNDSSASTGARTVTITGLDGNYAQQEETISLGGFVGITSANSYLRIFRMKVSTAGNSDTAEGKIVALPDQAGSTFTAAGVPTTTSNVLAAMATGTNQTRMAIYTVPASYTAYMTGAYASVSENNEAEITYVQREENSVFQVKGTFHIFRNNFSYDPKVPVPIPSKTDIELRASGSTSSADVAAGFDLLLIDINQ